MLRALLLIATLSLGPASAWAEPAELTELVRLAVKDNHEVIAASSRIAAADARVPQAYALPDPMIMVGYENDGLERYNYGQTDEAIWMLNVSQMVPYPGKRDIKRTMAEKEAEAQVLELRAMRLSIASRIREAYYDIYLTYKARAILEEQKKLFERLEDSALSRYAAGMASQQDVFMVQREKYMLLERISMYTQKLLSQEAMLNALIGRDTGTPISKPAEITRTKLAHTLDEMLVMSEASPDIESKRSMHKAASARLSMAEREHYPDFTVTAGIKDRGTEMDDMYSLTVSAAIPIHYKSRQRQAVREADALRTEAEHAVDAQRRMHHASIREAWAMIESADRNIVLYQDALIPKARQGFEAGLSTYSSGKAELMGVLGSLTSLQDYRIAYWTQFAEREKALARVMSITGQAEDSAPDSTHDHAPEKEPGR